MIESLDILTYLFTPWSRVLLEKLTGSRLVKKYPAFMEPEISLPHSQATATCPYPEPVRPSSCLTSHFLKSILILSCCLLMDLPSCIFPSGFPLKTLYTSLLSPIRATCPAHLILLDFIPRTMVYISHMFFSPLFDIWCQITR